MMDRRTMAVPLTALLWLSIGCGDGGDGRHPTATVTSTAAPSVTPTPPLATSTPTPTPPSATRTCVCPLTFTPTVATPTPIEPRQPEITYFGIARADDLALAPALFDDAGRPVYVRVQGQGMTIVLEARPGGHALLQAAYDPNGGPRGVDFLVSNPLGDGSPAVCDFTPPMIGGVPGIDPPEFSGETEVVNAIEDLGCRVNDGTGTAKARVEQNACTRMDPSFEYGFVDQTSQLQYCLPVAKAWNFPVGDTIVAALVRDVAGVVSDPREIVVRVEREPPFTCKQGLGERTFTVRRPPSRLQTSASGTADASADPWVAGTLRLCAGNDLGGGVHPLSLREDAVIGLALADGGTLCAKIGARGSSGSIDCDGGSPADVRALRDSEGLTRVAVDTELGLDAGTGAATIRAPIALLQLAPGSTPDDCQSAVYPPAFNGALTTATGTAQVLAFDGTVVAESSATGANLDCATWQAGGSEAFVLPFPVVKTGAGDLAAVLELND